jgi:hypothetical protein
LFKLNKLKLFEDKDPVKFKYLTNDELFDLKSILRIRQHQIKLQIKDVQNIVLLQFHKLLSLD